MSNFNVFEKIVSEIKKDKKEKFGGKTMSKIKVQPTMTESTASYYRDNFKKPASAMADILESARDYTEANPTTRMFETPLEMLTWTLETNKAMQRQSKRTLKGVFSANELTAIISVMNATILTYGIPGDTLQGNIDDVLPGELPVEIYKDELRIKLSSLGIYERSYLELWAWSFWYAPGFDDRDLESYIQQLL